jgi:hypothetical protein
MREFRLAALLFTIAVALFVCAGWLGSAAQQTDVSGNIELQASEGYTHANPHLLLAAADSEEEKEGAKGEDEDKGEKKEEKKDDGPKGWDRLWDAPKLG